MSVYCSGTGRVMRFSTSARCAESSAAFFVLGSMIQLSTTTDHAVIRVIAFFGSCPSLVAATIPKTSPRTAAYNSWARGSTRATRCSVNCAKLGSSASSGRFIPASACASLTLAHLKRRAAHFARSRRAASSRDTSKCSCDNLFASASASADEREIARADASAARASTSARSESALLCQAMIAAAPVARALTIEMKRAADSMLRTLSVRSHVELTAGILAQIGEPQ